MKLLVVGDSYYEDEYKKMIYKLAKHDERIIFTSFINRNDYGTLLKNSFVYVETKISGGTHPSFIEALGLKGFVIINDHPGNYKIFKEFNILKYSLNKNKIKNLKRILKKSITMPKTFISLYFKLAQKFVKKNYNSEEILKKYKRIINLIIK